MKKLLFFLCLLCITNLYAPCIVAASNKLIIIITGSGSITNNFSGEACVINNSPPPDNLVDLGPLPTRNCYNYNNPLPGTTPPFLCDFVNMGCLPEWCIDCGTPNCGEYQGWCNERDHSEANGFCNSALDCYVGICVKTCTTNSDCTGIAKKCIEGHCLYPCKKHTDCLHVRSNGTLECSKSGYCVQPSL